MSEVTLTLRLDPVSGRKELIVHLESEDDALPAEHERDHRELVEALLGRSVDALLEELGADGLEVVRVGKGEQTTLTAPEQAAERARQRQREGE